MKASISWLKDYVDIKESPEEIAHKLIMAGVHVASITEINGDSMLEFEITSNRSDCLSIIGIAREIAALFGKDLYIPEDLKKDKTKFKKIGSKAKGNKFIIEIKDKDLCPRYSGRIISGVKISESPDWLKKKLSSIGLRTINNIVDVTNFILMETGQPMHAFDLDKIKGKVIVRRAVKGETIKIIDGTTKILDEEMLVIADQEKPIAIAGVMGGLSTEVTSETKNVLLESAFFDPISVRRTARKLGVSTDASYRFERRIDVNMIIETSIRAANIIRDIASGTIGDLIDIGNKTQPALTIKLNPVKTSEILGVEIKAADQKKMLETLNFNVKRKKNYFEVTSVTARKDINQEVDLIEEIARIYGYDNIPETIPPIIGNTVLETKDNKIKKEIRKVLSLLGLNEIITYTLMPRKSLEKFGPYEDMVGVQNPLSQDQAVMANTLLAGMLKTISWNLNRKNENLDLFEVGKKYQKISDGKHKEKVRVSIGITGTENENWVSVKRKKTFYDIKGIVDKLLKKLGMENIEYTPSSEKYFSIGADIILSGEKIGVIGKPSKDIMDTFEIKEDVYVGEIYLSKICDKCEMEKSFSPLPKFQVVLRDISIVVDKTIPSAEIISVIKKHSTDNIKSVYLISTYQGEQIPKDKINLLYRLEYRNEDRTLTEEEVEKEHENIKKNLIEKIKVSFR